MKRGWMATGVAVCAVAALGLGGSAFAAQGSGGSAFTAVLSGANEVPPTTSSATGVSSLLLSSDGSKLFYSLEVTGASSTIGAAHIHVAAEGQNGDVVANLCGAGGTPACTTEGVTTSGSITDANLVGPLANKSLGDLVSAMQSGGAYVNAHTANSPGGELRGQIQAQGGDMMSGEHLDASQD